ncbi:hemagglutinin, partial [Collimonas pratensis]|uniref:Ig-like domain-containing protein n=1 Tax=Collimonas pratensis TaxID=279113 RepID=UPI001A012EAD
LPDGPHVFSATATNAAGGTSVPSAPINFIVDTSGVAIAITGVIDNEGPITGPISRDGVTDDPRPQIVGTATPNSLVLVYDNGTLIGSTTANAQGRWTLDPSADLPDGMNAITATSTNTATGVVSDPTAPFNFNLDTHIPLAPVIEGADDNVGAITGPIVNNGSTDDSTPTLHGTAEPHSIVTIYDGTLALGSVQAGADGSWIFTPTTPLTDGPHDFTATATDAAGKTGPASNDWAVNIDTGLPLAPTIGEIDDNTEPHTGPIPDGGVTNDNQPVLVGTGTPGDVVTIIDNGTPIGSAQVGDDGSWTFRPTNPLPDGDHDFTVIETNPVGSVSDPSPPHSIIVDTTSPNAPVIDGADDNVGVTGPIPNNGT